MDFNVLYTAHNYEYFLRVIIIMALRSAKSWQTIKQINRIENRPLSLPTVMCGGNARLHKNTSSLARHTHTPIQVGGEVNVHCIS